MGTIEEFGVYYKWKHTQAQERKGAIQIDDDFSIEKIVDVSKKITVTASFISDVEKATPGDDGDDKKLTNKEIETALIMGPWVQEFLRKVFNLLDRNKDGHLDEGEL